MKTILKGIWTPKRWLINADLKKLDKNFKSLFIDFLILSPLKEWQLDLFNNLGDFLKPESFMYEVWMYPRKKV